LLHSLLPPLPRFGRALRAAAAAAHPDILHEQQRQRARSEPARSVHSVSEELQHPSPTRRELLASASGSDSDGDAASSEHHSAASAAAAAVVVIASGSDSDAEPAA
jgi:hypothetical protein